MSMTPEYYEKLQAGLEYQDYVAEQLFYNGMCTLTYGSKEYQLKRGENMAGWEVKFDRKFRETGNFYIETAEKSNEAHLKWYPSGIYRNDNTWLYMIGDYDQIYIFSKQQLQKVHGCIEKLAKQKTGVRVVEIKTSQGFVIPVEYATERGLVIKKIECRKLVQEIQQ